MVNNRNNRKISKKVYTLSIAITISIIMLTFSFNWYLNFMREMEIEENIREMQLSMEDSQLEFVYMTNYMKGGCNVLEKAAMDLSEELQENNRKLSRYEKQNEQEFERLKAEHTMIFARLWMMNLELKQECNSSRSTLLYFFDVYSDESAQQGYVLDSVYNQYEEDIFIFPMDAEFDMGIINLLKNEFNITRTPTIIIDETEKLEGLTPKNEIEEILFG